MYPLSQLQSEYKVKLQICDITKSCFPELSDFGAVAQVHKYYNNNNNINISSEFLRENINFAAFPNFMLRGIYQNNQVFNLLLDWKIKR